MRSGPFLAAADAVTRIAHFANAADVDTVIVESEVLMRRRRPLRVDQTAILEEAAAELRRALDRTDLGHLAAEPADCWRTARREAISYPVAR